MKLSNLILLNSQLVQHLNSLENSNKTDASEELIKSLMKWWLTEMNQDKWTHSSIANQLEYNLLFYLNQLEPFTVEMKMVLKYVDMYESDIDQKYENVDTESVQSELPENNVLKLVDSLNSVCLGLSVE